MPHPIQWIQCPIGRCPPENLADNERFLKHLRIWHSAYEIIVYLHDQSPLWFKERVTEFECFDTIRQGLAKEKSP